jgi:hypothetical protein
MKFIKNTLMLGLALLCIPFALGAAKYAGEIFYLSPGVANQAMGNTGYTNEEAFSAAWWNPALLALPVKKGVELMHSAQFDGLMQFNHLAAIFGSKNRMGLVVTHAGIDNIALTKLENDSLPPSVNNQPYVWKKVKNNDLIAYLGIGRSLKDNLQTGITPKLAYRSLAEKTGFGFGADLGLLWAIRQNLKLGVVAKDFFSTQIIWENGTTETALPSLNTELGWQVLLTKKLIPIRIAVSMENLFEGREEAATVNAGAVSADFHAGLSVAPIQQLKVMAGMDVDTFTAGAGIYLSQLSIEYAGKFASSEDLGYSQRISAGWRW